MQVGFADLRAGIQAKVSAVSDGSTLSGSLVELSGDVGTPTQLRGVIANLSRDGSAFQFRIGDRVVRGDAATEVLDGSRLTDSSPLRNGQSVDVDALQRSSHLYGKRVTLRTAEGSGSSSPSGPVVLSVAQSGSGTGICARRHHRHRSDGSCRRHLSGIDVPTRRQSSRHEQCDCVRRREL